MSNGKNRSQGIRQRAKKENEEPKTEIGKMFLQYRTEMDNRNDTHENIYKAARDVIIESKRVIFILQRAARIDESGWAAIFAEADGKIKNIKIKIGEIRILIGKNRDQYMFNRAFDFAIEEFIEAIGFYWFLKWKKMPSVVELEKEINIPVENAPMFELDLCTFVFGLADVAGEVMRFTTSSIDSDTIDNSLKFMRQMYDVFISIQEKDLIYRSKNMNQKVNAMFSSLIKIEQLCYKMKIRKLEFGEDQDSKMIREMIRRDLTSKSVNQSADVGFYED